MVLSIEHDHDNIAILSWNWKKRGIDLFLLGGPAHVDGWLRCALMKYILNRYLSQNKIWFNAYMTVVLKKKKNDWSFNIEYLNVMCCTFISFNAYMTVNGLICVYVRAYNFIYRWKLLKASFLFFGWHIDIQ